jgi:hypothetical protein
MIQEDKSENKWGKVVYYSRVLAWYLLGMTEKSSSGNRISGSGTENESVLSGQPLRPRAEFNIIFCNLKSVWAKGGIFVNTLYSQQLTRIYLYHVCRSVTQLFAPEWRPAWLLDSFREIRNKEWLCWLVPAEIYQNDSLLLRVNVPVPQYSESFNPLKLIKKCFNMILPYRRNVPLWRSTG